MDHPIALFLLSAVIPAAVGAAEAARGRMGRAAVYAVVAVAWLVATLAVWLLA